MATKAPPKGKRLVAHLRRQPGVRDAEALAAWIGRFKLARNKGLSVADAKAAAGGKTGGKDAASEKKTITLPNKNKATYDPATKTVSVPSGTLNPKGEGTKEPLKQLKAIEDSFPESEKLQVGDIKPVKFKSIKAAFEVKAEHDSEKAAGFTPPVIIKTPTHGEAVSYNPDTKALKLPFLTDSSSPEKMATAVSEAMQAFPEAETVKVGTNEPSQAAAMQHVLSHVLKKPKPEKKEPVHALTSQGASVKYDPESKQIHMAAEFEKATVKDLEAITEALEMFPQANTIQFGDDKPTQTGILKSYLGMDKPVAEPGLVPEGVLFTTPKGTKVYAVPPKHGNDNLFLSMGPQGETALYYDNPTDKAEVLLTAEDKGIQHDSAVSGSYSPQFKEISIQGTKGATPKLMLKQLQADFPDKDTQLFNSDTATTVTLHDPPSDTDAPGPKVMFETAGIGGYSVPIYDSPSGAKAQEVLAQPGGSKIYFDPFEFSGNASVLDAAENAGMPFKSGTFFSGSFDPNTKHLNIYTMPEGASKKPSLKAYFQVAFPEADTATLPDGGKYTLKGTPTFQKKSKAASAPVQPAKLGKGIDEPFDADKPGGHFNSPSEANNWALEAYQPWLDDSLTHGEQLSMKDYKGSGYRPINEALRNAQGDDPKYVKRVSDIDRAIEKAPPLPDDIVVYRGRLPTPILEAFEAGAQDGLIGKTIADPAYMSTSMDRGVAKNFGYSTKFPRSIGKIKLPKGAKVAHLEGLTAMGEHEMLLPRDAPVKITKAYIDDSGMRIIEGEMIVPENSLDKMSLADLRKRAEERGVAFKGLTKKALIAKLRGE